MAKLYIIDDNGTAYKHDGFLPMIRSKTEEEILATAKRYAGNRYRTDLEKYPDNYKAVSDKEKEKALATAIWSEDR